MRRFFFNIIALITAVLCFGMTGILPFECVVSAEGTYDYSRIFFEKKDSYIDYYEQYINENRPDREVVVRGVDYKLASGGEFVKGKYGTEEVKNDVLIWNSAEGKLTYNVDIPETGVYNIAVSYCPVASSVASIEFSMSIDGTVPYDTASRISLPETWINEKPVTENSKGNQIRPSQVQYSRWFESPFMDTDGLFNDPLCFYLTKGTHVITFEASRAYIAIEYIKFFNSEELLKYSEIMPSQAELKTSESTLIRIEGEDAIYKSDSTLYPTSDNSSYLASPSKPGKMLYNTIGDGTWNKSLQTISWLVPADTLKTDGWYKIGIKSRQREMRGFYSNRRIYVDGKVFCRELDQVKFYYDTDWRLVCPEDENGETVYIYLTAAEDHIISMEAIPGEIGASMCQLEPIVYDINEYYRKILMITGPSPDKYTDYNLEKSLSELISDFTEISEKLKNIKNNIELLSGSSGSEAAGIERMYIVLDKCIENPQKIPQYLSQLKDNVAAISAWMRDYKAQPLEIDYIEIASSDMNFSNINENLLKSAAFGVKSFFASFFEDYSMISDEVSEDVLNVWINLGRDQALAIKELVESDFTPETGIQVNLNLVQGGVVEAALADKGPDIALFLGGEFPVNLAARGLLCDLSKFEGIDDILAGCQPEASVMYQYEGGTYALPLEQNFPVMFYRKDILSELGCTSVPQTWDDLVDLIPVLQRNYMYAGLVLPGANISPSTEPGHTFALLMLQNGLNYYNSSMTATTFDNIKAIQSFERWTDLYTKYKFEQVYDAFSRFRDGTYPIVIQNYTFYNQLKTAAPELNGLWDFTVVPGTVCEDGTISHAANSSGSGAVIFEKTKNKEDAWKFIQWFASSDVQSRYGITVEGLLGTMGRYAAANSEALSSLSWTSSELQKLELQRSELHEIPVIPASYAVTRNIMTAFRTAVNEHDNPRDTIMWYNRDINIEIQRKRENLGLK